MKDCCKTETEKPKTQIGKILKWIFYLAIAGLLVFVLLRQFAEGTTY